MRKKENILYLVLYSQFFQITIDSTATTSQENYF